MSKVNQLTRVRQAFWLNARRLRRLSQRPVSAGRSELSHVEAVLRCRSSIAASLALSPPGPLPHQRRTLPNTMQQYYRARAVEYDLFYQVPERLSELTQLQAWLIERTRGQTILEV